MTDSIIATGAVFSFLAALAVTLRFYCRLRVIHAKIGVDDWLMLGSLFLTLGLGIMLIAGGALHGLAEPTPEGWGKHDYFWVIDDAEIITEKVIFWVFNMVQDLSFGLAKLSVLFFYRRIFSTPIFKGLNTTLMVIVSILSVGFFFAYLFRCGTNFWALWAPLEDLIKYCYTSTPMFYALGISDVITDVFVLSLPFFWVSLLISVSCLHTQELDPYENADGIGHLTTMMFWSMIEMGIAIVAGCLPTIWPLISKVSLENMVRTVRSVLSLESLRESSGKSSKNRSGAGADKRDHSNENGGPYIQFPGHTSLQQKPEPGEVHQGQPLRGGQEVARWETPHSESLQMQDLGVRTVTEVSASGNLKHGDSYV
ncbi:hypothetical protein VM1G_09143 [Cytospora mali]|uniref:Rhodopsin domain-containing protein n=1 Tax=Cytospora mali TaxID=578113 RepID=A0A194WAF9_CYTMA|nr:hypothetical protein VM1G_09143 [Valsa mali]